MINRTNSILIVDDDERVRALFAACLRTKGYEVREAETGGEGLQLAQKHMPDLVLLDVRLPDISGVEICKGIRTSGIRTPIIVLSAIGEEIDKVLLLEIGADDYVVKPFSVRELLLRIDAVLRRGRSPDQRLIEVAELHIDKEAHRVTVGGEEVALTALEFKLLVTLTERRDRVQGRGTLLSDVWAMDSEIASRTVDTHVKRLRDKLGTAGRFIETVRGVGYRFSEAPSPEE